jgi:hypothetical protein
MATSLPSEAIDFIRRVTLMSIAPDEYAFILDVFQRTEKMRPAPGTFLREFERTWKVLAAARPPTTRTTLFDLLDRIFRCSGCLCEPDPASARGTLCADLIVRACCGAADLACVERPCP